MNVLWSIREVFVQDRSVMFSDLMLSFKVNDLRLLLLELVDNLLDTEHCLVDPTHHVLSILILSCWITPPILHYRRHAHHIRVHPLLFLNFHLRLVILHPVLSA